MYVFNIDTKQYVSQFAKNTLSYIYNIKQNIDKTCNVNTINFGKMTKYNLSITLGKVTTQYNVTCFDKSNNDNLSNNEFNVLDNVNKCYIII